MSTAILTAHTLAKSYRAEAAASRSASALRVIDNISFELHPGEILGILGASGCGKTTLLKLIAGLITPDEGSCTATFARPGPRIGFLQQGERLLPWRNVLQNVALGLELSGSKKRDAEEAASKLLHDVGMEEFSASYPSQLSGGMAQRVLLARTLATRPEILLLDEPLGQLDVIGRRALAQIIRSYVDKHRAAALIVTHSVEEAVFISDFIFTLSRRPSRIVARFDLREGDTLSSSGVAAEKLSRAHSFDVVLKALLRALDSSAVGSSAVDSSLVETSR